MKLLFRWARDPLIDHIDTEVEFGLSDDEWNALSEIERANLLDSVMDGFYENPWDYMSLYARKEK